MNERIKELVRQAADYANTYSDAGADVWFEMYNKKFAELIIRECAGIVKYYHSRNESVNPGQILQHFRVSES